MSDPTIRITLALLAALIPCAAAGQAPDTASDRWAAALDLGFNGARGNTEIVTFATGFQLERLETRRFALEWNVGFRYGESEGHVVARNVQSSLNFDFYPSERWSPFVYVAAERDPFKRLDLRTDGGAGAKYTISDDDAASASLSLALLHRYENFSAEAGSLRPSTLNSARWSLRARAARRVRDGLRVENTTFYKPVYDRPGDYDLDSVTKLSVLLNSRLALAFSYLYRVDSTPPADVGREDQVLTAGLTVHF